MQCRANLLLFLILLAGGPAAADTRVHYSEPPDPLLAEVEDAAESVNAGDRAAGIGKLREVLKQNPVQRQALETLAQVYLQDEREAEAADLVKRCIKKYSDSWRCRTVQGRILLDAGDAEAAEATLQKAVNSNGADPEARLYLGMARMRLNKLERAEVDLNHALVYRKKGTLSAVFLHLAGIYDRLKRPFKAAQHLEWFLREKPDAPNAALLRERIQEFRSNP